MRGLTVIVFLLLTLWWASGSDVDPLSAAINWVTGMGRHDTHHSSELT